MTIAPASVPLRIDDLPCELSLFVHGDEDRHVSHRLREEGTWEPCETALVTALLGPGQVCVDVGANIGYFTVLAAALVGEGGSVFAFEPDPANCALLRRSRGRDLVELLAAPGEPLWIVDHLEHRLAPTTAADLARWCDNVQDTAGDRGFMNILVGPAP